MAEFEFIQPLEIMQELRRLENNAPETMKKMVEEGMTVMHKAILSRVPVKTGGLRGSLTLSGGHSDSFGCWYANDHFLGYDENKAYYRKRHYRKVPHALKAMAYEYGTPTQKARPFLRPAMKAAEKEAYKAMQDVYDRRSKK